MIKTRRYVLAIAGAAVLAGCQDLVVENINAPDRHRAIHDPASVETLIVGSWRDKLSRLHNTTTGFRVIPLVADVFTGTYANDAALELSSEPRVALNNNPISDAHAVTRFHWESYYRANANATDGLGAIMNGLRIRTGEGDNIDQTTRAWSFAKWMQAISHGSIALTHDQGFVVTEYTDLEDPRAVPLIPYTALRDTAITLMLQAIDTLNAHNITFPEWIPTQQYTSQQLARLGHSYIVRWLVYNARTPEERAAVDWQRVLRHLDLGIQQDYRITLASDNVVSSYFSLLQTAGTFSAWADYKMIGPADVSGAFATWLNTPLDQRQRFPIVTPDRRITGATPQSNGSYFRWRANNIMVEARGTYHNSHYQWYRHVYNYGSPTTIATTGYLNLMTVDEMNLIRAEALARLGRNAEAAEFANITRTRQQRPGGGTNPLVPNLPPLTANGVVQSADCVPRLDGVKCADLLGAIMYERILEIAAHDAWSGWHDSRGWGRLPEGTFLHIPISAREAQALGIEVYSFGGVGGPGAAVCNTALMPLCK
jgi:hypothetical protein